MEYYGTDLKHYLTSEFDNMKWYTKLYNLIDIIKGLDIHSTQIIHRDLHSGNILNNVNTIICDFGQGKPSTESTDDEEEIYGVIPYVLQKYFKRKIISRLQIYIVLV